MPSKRVEGSGLQHVIQYRGQILPLIYLSSVLSQSESQPPATEPGEMLEMLVVSVDEQHSVGLVVDNIIDIVEEQILMRGVATQAEIQCSVVLQDRVTELIDVDAVIRVGAPQLLPTPVAV